MHFFRVFFGSFYDPKLYQSVWREPGYRLGYSALLVAISTLLLVIAGTVVVHRALFVPHDNQPPLFDDMVHQVASQLPVMTLDHGHLVTKNPAPTTITLTIRRGDLNGTYAFATIDTTGATTYENMKTPMLVTAREVVVLDKNKGEKKIYALDKYSPKNPLVINHALALDMADQLIRYVHGHLAVFYLFGGVFMGALFGIVYYVLRVFMLLALGLVGLIISGVMGLSLTYETAMRMAAVSYTPVATFYLLAQLTGGHWPGTLTLLLCGGIMLLAAILVARDETLAATD